MKKHDYGPLDHAICTAVEAGSNNFTTILTDRMVCLEVDVIHEQEMNAWSRKSALVYQGFPPPRQQILDRRLQALRKSGVIVYAKGKWQKADQQGKESQQVDQTSAPDADRFRVGDWWQSPRGYRYLVEKRDGNAVTLRNGGKVLRKPYDHIRPNGQVWTRESWGGNP
jgi:hypothetical protein